MSDLKKIAKSIVRKIEEGGKTAIIKVPEVIKTTSSDAKKTIDKAKTSIISTADQDGNGVIDSYDLILIALKVPGVKIKRADFLQKELFKYCPQDTIDKAIAQNPAKAGIDKKTIDRIAEEVIKFERNAVSGISAALGMPGGAAMAATIPADIAQYYGYMLRAAQKLLYLYGFPDIGAKENDVNLDSETMNSLTICLGVMYGVASANNAIKAMAKALAVGVEKQLLKRALTKGAIYPVVKAVAKWFSVKMTKEVFAGFFKKAIPVAGGVIGGGITFLSFKPCCDRLKNALMDTILSNPEHVESEEETKLFESIQGGIIDVDAEDIVVIDEDIIEENENNIKIDESKEDKTDKEQQQ
ncbi:MAG: hypothetical protein IJK56_00930 [Firmicutes bacterium]|nr:hypothetical protein [Bacillota bacterium]